MAPTMTTTTANRSAARRLLNRARANLTAGRPLTTRQILELIPEASDYEWYLMARAGHVLPDRGLRYEG